MKEFVKKINHKIKIVDNPENCDYWRMLRHGLVHLFLPKSGSSVGAVGPVDFAAGMSLYNFKKSLLNKSDVPAISKKSKNNKGFNCNADLLVVKLL